MKVKICIIGVVLTVVLTGHVHAAVIFDNGLYSGGQIGIQNMTWQRVYEDFRLTVDTEITGVFWQQHNDPNLIYNGTRVMIYNGQPEAVTSTLVFSNDVYATGNPNGIVLPFDVNDVGYDYVLEGLSITLSPGIYWLGLNTIAAGGYSSWDNTAGTVATIENAWIVNSSYPYGAVYEYDMAFKLYGQPAIVPEPATMLLFGSGLLGLLGLRRKFKK